MAHLNGLAVHKSFWQVGHLCEVRWYQPVQIMELVPCARVFDLTNYKINIMMLAITFLKMKI